jgi:hypothetical protein
MRHRPDAPRGSGVLAALSSAAAGTAGTRGSFGISPSNSRTSSSRNVTKVRRIQPYSSVVPSAVLLA